MERVKGDGLAWPKYDDSLSGWAAEQTTSLSFADPAFSFFLFFFANLQQLSVAITD